MKSLAQALGRVLPLAALISMLVTPSMTAAQTLEGDKNIDASMAIIDVKSQSELTVVQAPDLGQVVRPEGNDLCTYTVKSNGETNILDEDRISINGDIVNSPDPFGTAGLRIPLLDCAAQSRAGMSNRPAPRYWRLYRYKWR